MAVGDEAPNTGNPAYDILTPTHRDTLIREGQTIERAYGVEDDRAIREAEKQRKHVSDLKEFEIFSELHKNPDSPAVTMQQIIDAGPTGSGILTKEAAERL